MSVIGIEKLEFGVDNLAACQQFLQDFGLQTSPNNPSYFTTLSGASVALSSIDDPRLPTPFESGSTLRRITWGVKDRVTLEQVIKQIEDCAGFQLTSDGAQCLDPNGMTVAFTISQQQDVTVDISPINQWGDIRRIDAPSPVYDKATPINIGHVVFLLMTYRPQKHSIAKNWASKCLTVISTVRFFYVHKLMVATIIYSYSSCLIAGGA